MKSEKHSPVKPLNVEPLEGWEPNSRYGIQRLDETQAGRLVRLEDVAVWLAQTKPRRDIIFELFFPLIASARHAVSLCLLNAESYAIPMIVRDRVNPAAAGFWQFLPSVDSDSFSEVLTRAIREGWERAWPGLSYPATDPDWIAKRAIARNKERKEMMRLHRLGLVTDPEPEPWPADDFLMQQLRRLAVPVSKAYELWGWGSVPAEVVQLAPVPAPALDMEPKPITTYQELREFRKANPGAPWTDEMQAVLAEEEARRNSVPGATGVRKALGADLGCSDKRIGVLIRDHQRAQPKPPAAFQRA